MHALPARGTRSKWLKRRAFLPQAGDLDVAYVALMKTLLQPEYSSGSVEQTGRPQILTDGIDRP